MKYSRYNEYKALQELQKKDPKAYRAKMIETSKRQMTEYRATLDKRKAEEAAQKATQPKEESSTQYSPKLYGLPFKGENHDKKDQFLWRGIQYLQSKFTYAQNNF